MTLYHVHVYYDLVIDAESHSEAKLKATKYVDGFGKTASVHKIQSVDDLPQGWTADTLPWYGDGETTIEEIINKKDTYDDVQRPAVEQSSIPIEKQGV